MAAPNAPLNGVPTREPGEDKPGYASVVADGPHGPAFDADGPFDLVFANILAEPLITMAKTDSVSKRRLAFSRLRDREVVTKLFNDLAPRFKDRPGGYVRILKCGYRAGDKAPMAYVELMDRPEAEA